MTVDTEMVVSKNPSILCTELDDEAVLLDLDTKCYYGLNEIALEIWKLIDGERKINSIMENICEKFDVTPDKALSSITRLVNELEENGLVITDAANPKKSKKS